ncbi:cyclic nucleotide-binding domain-containing protein [Rhodobacterales bacterium HKCCSP123]|nr:cyclic nucleotide-binding domain-containing protein [Rhodobacterales bacterium HKCCSP123]
MTSFYDALRPEDRAELDDYLDPIAFEPGEALFHQGDVTEGAFLVEEGTIELTMTLPGAETVPIARVGPGSFVGEVALLQDAHRTLTAVAVGKVRAKYLDAVDFRSLLNGNRPSAFMLLKEVASLVARRVYETERAILDLLDQRPAGRAVRPCDAGAPPRRSDFDPLPYLGAFPLFSSCARRDREEFVKLARVFEAPDTSTLLRAGETGTSCWIVVRGALEAICPASRIRLAVLGPGAQAGLLEGLIGVPQQTTVRVRERATLLELRRDDFETLLSPTSRLSYRMLQGISAAAIHEMERKNLVLARERRLLS